jgi:hypothetical protein
LFDTSFVFDLMWLLELCQITKNPAEASTGLRGQMIISTFTAWVDALAVLLRHDLSLGDGLENLLGGAVPQRPLDRPPFYP